MTKKDAEKNRLQVVCGEAFHDARVEALRRKLRANEEARAEAAKQRRTTGVDAVDAFGHALGAWVRCVHCERCYRVGEFRLVRGLQMCPYPDCSGDTVFDAFPWEGSEDPERGVVYHLYE